jgi:hypothetical protein
VAHLHNIVISTAVMFSSCCWSLKVLLSFIYSDQLFKRKILDFRHEVNEVSAFLGFYTASIGSFYWGYFIDTVSKRL